MTVHDAIFKGCFDLNVANLDRPSPFITFFETGIDSRTLIALQSCADGCMDSTPDMRALMSWVDGKYGSIDSKLNARFGEFTKQRTIKSCDFDDLCCERLRADHSPEPFNQEAFLDMLCRTGTFPIDSDETFLLISACAQAAVEFCDGPEFAYKCLDALFVHNNRRYNQRAQRQHRVQEDRYLKSGLFLDTTAAACRRYVNRDYDNEMNSPTSDDERNSPTSDDEDILTEEKTFKDTTSEDDSSFKQISRDRVMLRGAFHFLMTTASAGSLMLSNGPMEIIRRLHSERGLYSISNTAYEAALQRSNTPNAVIDEFVLHGGCNQQRKELCYREFHRLFERRRKFNPEQLKAEFDQATIEPASDQVDISLQEFESRLHTMHQLATSPGRIVRFFRLYGGGDDHRKELCCKAFIEVSGAELAGNYSTEWINKIFMQNLGIRTPSTVFSPYTDEREKGLGYSLEQWAFVDRQAGRLPQVIAGITADEVYSERYVRALPLDQEVVAVRSACGTGKSVACREFLKSIPAWMPIVQVTHRKALSHELCRLSIGGRIFELYYRIIENEGSIDLRKHKTLNIQFESLSRLDYYDGPIVVICDEINSILTQMLSPCGDTHASHRRFVNLLHNAEKVVFFDAFLDDDRLALINKYTKKKAHVIHNTCKTLSKYTFKFTGDRRMAMKFLATRIRNGENATVPCFLKSDAEAVYEYMRGQGLTEQEVLIFTGDKPFPKGEDVNEVWGKCRVVIYTTCMDCGHSFNLVHFHVTVCFFSNMVNIPYEIALQLMARSRKTIDFVICFPPGPTPRKKSIVITEILEELRAKNAAMVQMENNLEWGYLGAYTSKYCAYLHVLATHIMMIRKSRSDQFQVLIKELLMLDGARMENMTELEEEDVEITDEDIAAITLAKKTAKDKQPGPRTMTLAQQYAPNQECIFVEPNMDDDARKVYGSRQTINAFQNLLALHSEGVDIESALKNIKFKIQCTQNLLDECSQSGNFCENSIAQTRCELAKGAESLVQTNEDALSLFQHLTNSTDLDNFDLITGSKMRRNLGCLDPMDPKSIVNPDIRNSIAEIYDRWSERKDLVYEKKVGKELTLTTSLTLLNHMLVSQFDMRLERTNKTSRKGGEKRDYTFTLIKYKHFQITDMSYQEILAYNAIHNDIDRVSRNSKKILPTLSRWNQNVSAFEDWQLLSSKKIEKIADVLLVGDARLEHTNKGILIVKLGLQFNHWPGRTSNVETELDYTPIIGSNEMKKKRKREDEHTKQNKMIEKAKQVALQLEELGKNYQIKAMQREATLKQERITNKRNRILACRRAKWLDSLDLKGERDHILGRNREQTYFIPLDQLRRNHERWKKRNHKD
jgi:hypothetical protein